MNSAGADAKPLTDQQRLTLRHLVQHVARTFFDVEQIVVLDQLAKHDVCVAAHCCGPLGSSDVPGSHSSPGATISFFLRVLLQTAAYAAVLSISFHQRLFILAYPSYMSAHWTG